MVESWGRCHNFNHEVTAPYYLSDIDFFYNESAFTTFYGQGRSYGDVALNNGEHVLDTHFLSRFQNFDWHNGILRAEAGVTLDQILQLIIPMGWFLPVTPGSKFVSLGGAVANDVHGKNHHLTGSLGAHVLQIGLRRTSGDRLVLSPQKNSELFNLTISGLGLTGLIEWVEIKLMPINSSMMEVENIPYYSLDEYFELAKESKDWQYSVAWIDCFASNDQMGRGIFTRAKHSSKKSELKVHDNSKQIVWPVEMPNGVLNRVTISLFNTLYRSRPAARFRGPQFYNQFFYPLDKIKGWNKLYGKKGFYQHQCIIPKQSARDAMKELLKYINESNNGSFLAVMKDHGPEHSPGLNSFCMEGTSLALDFSNKENSTIQLLERLNDIVNQYKGRIYPAKDSMMSSSIFQQGFPNWIELEKVRDPGVNSSFWLRVTGDS
ncbi:FAD-binding oxidoreductase [Alphaproteobacteria bacterium]|nr:FAD-binding oxidoreductase [Alphaproteobacteria bacterium]